MNHRAVAAIGVLLTVAVAHSVAARVPVTRAQFIDAEHGELVVRAFQHGPCGLRLLPGRAAVWCAHEEKYLDRLVGTRADGSLDLELGEVRFGETRQIDDAFRIANGTGASRGFRVRVMSGMTGLVPSLGIKRDPIIRAGREGQVWISINGGARPPGLYTGTLLVEDYQGEFIRIVRVRLRVLSTHQGCDEPDDDECEERPDPRAPTQIAPVASESGAVDAPRPAPTASEPDSGPVAAPVEPAEPTGPPGPEPETSRTAPPADEPATDATVSAGAE